MKRYFNHANYLGGSCLILTICFGSMCAADNALATNQTHAAFACIMHVHTRMSSGLYQLPDLTAIAITQKVDVIFLSDNLLESIEFGLPALRHVFWAGHQEKPTGSTTFGGQPRRAIVP